LHQFKACQSETVGRNNWDDLWVESDEESLDLNPFLLLLSKVVTPCPLFDFFIELFNDDRNEEIHDEEAGKENENDVDDGVCLVCVEL